MSGILKSTLQLVAAKKDEVWTQFYRLLDK